MRILYIDIDTLRPDHMGCYGYFRNTTPRLDEIARDGVRFDQAYCSDAPCLPSRAALISGMLGIKTGAVGHGGTAGDRWLYGEKRGFRDPVDENNFNNIFRKAGLYCCSFSSFPERHSSYWYSAGFHETHNVGKGGGECANEVIDGALEWLERRGAQEDWYLHVHVWDPHTPYRAPADFGNPFAKDPLPDWLTEELFRQHQQLVSPHGCNEINMYDDHESSMYPRHPGKINTYQDLRRLFDGYDCGVRYADQQLGRVLDQLKKLGIYEDTAIIVTSDHGENLGELGIYGEHGTADECTCHIPLIIKWPGGVKGTTDNGFHYQLDLCPTMAELLNIQGNPDWDGISFAPALHGEPCPGREYLVVSQLAHVCQRAARFDHYLYIRTVHDGFRLLNREMLFDLEADPHEIQDISQKHPDLCAKGARLLLNFQEDAMLSSRYAEDPLWRVMREGGPSHTVGWLDYYCAHLEKTGRSEGARRLREKFGQKQDS